MLLTHSEPHDTPPPAGAGRTSLPDRARVLRRHAMRAPVGHDWQLRLMGLGQRAQLCRVTDCSMGGLAVVADPACLAHLDTAFLGQATLEVGGKLICPVLLTLRHQQQTQAAQRVLAGLQLGFASPQDKAAYQSMVRRVLFKHVRSGARVSQTAWQVLAGAGFFDLGGRHPQHAEQQKAAYLAFNTQLEAAPHLGQQLVWQDADGAPATLSWVKPFARTRVLHHFGRTQDAARGQAAVRELLLCCLEMGLCDKQTQYLAAFVHADATPQKAHALAFAQARAASGHTAVLPAQFYEVNSLCDAGVTFDACLHMRQLRPADVAMVAQAVERRRGALYAHAFDLTQSALRTNAACAAWAQAGLVRERQVMLVCGADNAARLAVVLDRVAPGSDVLGALDALTLVPLHAELTHPSLQSALELILAYAKNWFLLRGAGHFCFADLDAAFSAAVPKGATGRGAGTVWLVHRPVFGALQTLWQAQLETSGAQSALQ